MFELASLSVSPFLNPISLEPIRKEKAHTALETTIHLSMYSPSGLELVNVVVRRVEDQTSHDVRKSIS
jgi:hypothetical protein